MLTKMDRVFKGFSATASPTANKARPFKPTVEMNFLRIYKWDYGNVIIIINQLTVIFTKRHETEDFEI